MTSDIGMELDEMKEIIDDFLIEADELIDSLDTNFVKLENNTDDLDLLNEIFRAVHTVKGTSSFLGFEQVTSLSHKMEDILNKLRKSEMTVTPDVMDVLLEALDLLKELLVKVRAGDKEELDLESIMARLMSISSTDMPDADKKISEEDESVDLAELVAQSRDKTKIAKTTKDSPEIKRTAPDQTIRVGVERLDALMNMMGELVLGRNTLIQSLGKLNAEHEGDFQLEELNHASNSISFMTTELQMAVMKMRMLPIGYVFKRYPRLVRDLSRDSGKQINLELSGETTELDKSVIEEIGDPLVHIIRNSCDHGIESPDERTAAGKPATGTVKLAASQEGSNIVITISDDGRGLDVEAIRNKAIEKGLITSAEAERVSDREILSYIFEPGFSTAKVVTDVSGRGVGMDVVRTNVEKLSGMVELNSEVGKGTTITIKLPLTLAIIQGLLAQVEDEVFILPLSSVRETVKAESLSVHFINQRPVIRLRDDIIPIINLVTTLQKKPPSTETTKKPYYVILGLAEKKLGIAIDRLLGQEEVVIKSLGRYLGSTEGIAGATILGDGRIRLIVDVIGLFGVAGKLN